MHWPAGLKAKPGTLNQQPGYITDIMPTLLELTGAQYPEEHNGQRILPHEGTSLVPVLNGGSLGRVCCSWNTRATAWRAMAIGNW